MSHILCHLTLQYETLPPTLWPALISQHFNAFRQPQSEPSTLQDMLNPFQREKKEGESRRIQNETIYIWGRSVTCGRHINLGKILRAKSFACLCVIRGSSKTFTTVCKMKVFHNVENTWEVSPADWPKRIIFSWKVTVNFF